MNKGEFHTKMFELGAHLARANALFAELNEGYQSLMTEPPPVPPMKMIAAPPTSQSIDALRNEIAFFRREHQITLKDVGEPAQMTSSQVGNFLNGCGLREETERRLRSAWAKVKDKTLKEVSRR